jgi:tRNA(adenine34) deaminase
MFNHKIHEDLMKMFDEKYMGVAMNEAKNCYSRGDLPVGAVLTIDNEIEGISGNSARTNGDWTSHAENSLLHKVSWKIKQSSKGAISKLYTTWEPCLMCAGAAVLSRVDEIIYACPDPLGGMSKLDKSLLGVWNQKHWPDFREGPFKEESYNLLIKYMAENKVIWGEFLKGFNI